jgi:glycerate-2-kinase
MTAPRPEHANALNAVIAAALAAVEPGEAVRRAVALQAGDLVVDGRRYSVGSYRRVMVVGAGKASAPMANAVEEVIGGRVPVEGSVTVRYGHSVPTRAVRIRGDPRDRRTARGRDC